MNAFHYTLRGSQPDNNPLQRECCYKTTLFDNRGSRTVTNRRRACSGEHGSWLLKNEGSLIVFWDWCYRLVLLIKEMKQRIQNTGSHFSLGAKLRKPMEMQQCWPQPDVDGACRAWQGGTGLFCVVLCSGSVWQPNGRGFVSLQSPPLNSLALQGTSTKNPFPLTPV